MLHSDSSFTLIVTRVASRYRSALAQEMLSRGLGHITPDYRIVLEALWQEDSISIGQLATRTSKDNASLTRILDGMERNDLVLRVRCASDRRTSVIVLTSHSKGIRERIEAVEQSVFTKAIKGFNPIEAKELERMLDEMYLNIGSG